MVGDEFVAMLDIFEEVSCFWAYKNACLLLGIIAGRSA
jgi:hypothetical protein